MDVSEAQVELSICHVDELVEAGRVGQDDQAGGQDRSEDACESAEGVSLRAARRLRVVVGVRIRVVVAWFLGLA